MSGTTTLLSAVSTNGAGTAYNTTALQDELSLAVSVSGTVTAFSVQLQGSIDGTNYENVGEAVLAPTAGVNVSSGVQYQYFQAVLAGYAGTGTVTCTLAYNLRAGSGGGGSGPPTGAAGGVLSGTYPNPGLAASPALTGTPTAPTATALTSTTQLATTAYADAATGVEKTRALAAEALALPLAGGEVTGNLTVDQTFVVGGTSNLASTNVFGALNMESNKITSLADGSSAQDAAAFHQITAANAGALPLAGGTMSGVIAMGAHKITGGAAATAGTDIPIYSQTAAGGTIVSGQYLCAPTSYAPGTFTQFTMNSTTLTAVSSTNISTGSFTAPVSGNVIVTVSFLGANGATAQNYAIGLLNHGLSTVAGNAVVNRYAANAAGALATVPFLVTGLSGTCNFDLAIATAGVGALTVNCQAISATTPSLANQAAPVLMTVQAV